MGFGKEKWATAGIHVKIIMELKCQMVKPSGAICMKPEVFGTDLTMVENKKLWLIDAEIPRNNTRRQRTGKEQYLKTERLWQKPAMAVPIFVGTLNGILKQLDGT